MKKFVCAAVVVMVTFSVAMSGEFQGIITNISGDTVTFQKTKKAEKQKGKKFQAPEPDGDPIKLKVTSSTGVFKMKFNKEDMKLEKGDAIEGGLKAEMFTKLPEKGQRCTIVTAGDTLKDGDTITEIRVFQFGGIKKKKDAQ
jgi:hypothetical protein